MVEKDRIRWSRENLHIKREVLTGKDYSQEGIDDAVQRVMEQGEYQIDDNGKQYELDSNKAYKKMNDAVIDETKEFIEEAIDNSKEYVSQRDMPSPISGIWYDEKNDEFVVQVSDKKELARRLNTLINGVGMFEYNSLADFIDANGGINNAITGHFPYILDYPEIYGRRSLKGRIENDFEQMRFDDYVEVKSYSHGGIIQRTGFAKVHKGELVIPASTVRRIKRTRPHYSPSVKRFKRTTPHYAPLRTNRGQGGYFRHRPEHSINRRKAWAKRRR